MESHMLLRDDRQLSRQGAEMGRLDALAVHQAGDFDDAIMREVVDQAGVQDISIYHSRLVGFNSFNDVRSILLAALHVIICLPQKVGAQLFVALLSPPWPVIGIVAALAPVAWPDIMLDQVRTLAEIAHVFGDVPAGLGAE